LREVFSPESSRVIHGSCPYPYGTGQFLVSGFRLGCQQWVVAAEGSNLNSAENVVRRKTRFCGELLARSICFLSGMCDNALVQQPARAHEQRRSTNGDWTEDLNQQPNPPMRIIDSTQSKKNPRQPSRELSIGNQSSPGIRNRRPIEPSGN
jgi:hypothetical protein